jgi:hypothetical protein
LDEMLDCILSQSKEIRPRYRVGMLSVPDGVRLLDDVGPSTGSSSCNDEFLWNIGRDDLEFGTVTTIEDGAVIYNFLVRGDGRMIAPG